MKVGFNEVDITPRVGVELCGFGPFNNRHSIGVHDYLHAKAVAFEVDTKKAVIVSCDLIGINGAIVEKTRKLISAQTGLTDDSIMIHCTHTHSGPNTANYSGWGDPDLPYNEVLPYKISKACIKALNNLESVKAYHAVVPCEGIGVNREYDKNDSLLEEVLQDDWRPTKPELTDTQCHVIKFMSCSTDQMVGFMAYFGCHPVVCCADCRYIHGDFCGVALNMLQRENPGSVGLFLQGAQGDVNSCVVHKPEKESLLALDIIANRFADSVRRGLNEALPLEINDLHSTNISQYFSVKDIPLEKLRKLLAENEAVLYNEKASDEDKEVRMATIAVASLRNLLKRIENGEDLRPLVEIQGIKIGPIEFIGAPFEIMQAIKNEVIAEAKAPITLVLGNTNNCLGYAPDKQVAARGGYAADKVPLICGTIPYKNIHSELVKALLEVDNIL